MKNLIGWMQSSQISILICLNETTSGTEATSNYIYFIVDDSGREYNAIDLAKEILNALKEIIKLHVNKIT
jgi:hypothetical protein